MALRLSGLRMLTLCAFVGRIRLKPPSGIAELPDGAALIGPTNVNVVWFCRPDKGKPPSGMAELPDGAALIGPANVDVVWFCRPDKAKAAIRHGGVAR